LLHLVLGRWIGSGWWTPDLTLVSIALAMAERRTLAPALLGGCLTMAVTVRHASIFGLAYAGAGWLIGGLARRWDLRDPRMQLVAVGIAEASLLAVGLALEVRISAGLLVLSGAKLAMTVACLPLARRLLSSVFVRR
jgi:hypothetical protein